MDSIKYKLHENQAIVYYISKHSHGLEIRDVKKHAGKKYAGK